MSLSGNLSFVPIDEVLRLLTRSGQESSVEVSGRGLFGRIFVGKRGIDLATTVKDGELHRQLVNSGCLDENLLRRVATGETTLAAVGENSQATIDLIREMTIESIYRISLGGDEFQVREGVTSPYASPHSFDLDELLRDSGTREKDWERIFEIIPDLKDTITFNRDLADRDEVTVKADDWKVLSVIGTGASVSEIGDSLGATEFWAASVTARLVKYDLLKVAALEPAAEPRQAIEQAGYDWAESEVPADVDEVYDEGHEVAEDEDLEMSQDAVSSQAEMSQEVVGVAPAGDDDESVDPNQSWWREPSGETPDSEDEVEEDTEAFLEKVFSELESSDENTEGYGLLRRRRMGSLRDFSSDS